jgi:hypothetical protein
MMKWEPLFAHLMKLFMRTEKLKKGDGKKTASAIGERQQNEPVKDYGGQKKNMTNNNRAS